MIRPEGNPLSIRLTRMLDRAKRRPGSHEFLIFIGFLALYVRTLCPSIYTFDSAELTAGAYSLGLVHPTGYPVYLMLAKLFTLIVPLGDIAYRVNLFSAVCAALGLMVLRRVAFIITGSAAGATLAAVMLGVSYPFWSEAVVAEVYTLHILFLVCILWLALRWRATGRAAFLICLGLVTGLSFGNHMSTILVVPGVAFLAWDTLRRRLIPAPPLRVWTLAGAACLAGLLTYLYLPIRYAADPTFNYAHFTGVDLGTVEGVLSFVRGTIFADWVFGYTLEEIPLETWKFLQLLWPTFLGVGPIVAAVGFVDLWKRDRTVALSLGLIFAANVVFFVNYRAFDKETMFLPVFLVLSLWIADGLRGLQDRLAKGALRRAVAWGSTALLLVMLVSNYPRVDLSGNWITRRYAEEVFQQVPPDALIVGAWIDITPLQYLQVVEGQRPDVRLFDYGLYSLHRRAAMEAGGIPPEDTWRITNDQIRQVVSEQLSNGGPAFSLGENSILESQFDLQQVSKWLYAITPADYDYERLRP